MPRDSKACEGRRAVMENQLACLGTALALVHGVREDLGVFVAHLGHAELIEPACVDLIRADRLVRRAQEILVEANADLDLTQRGVGSMPGVVRG